MKSLLTLCLFLFLFTVTISFCHAENFVPEIFNISIPAEEKANWKIGFQNGNPSDFILEYVPLEETVTNWSQLLTLLFMSNKELNGESKTAVSAMKAIFREYQEQYPDNFKYNVLQETENDVLYETFIPKFGSNPSEYEVVRLVKTLSGIHRLSYAIKGGFTDIQKKAKWIQSIKDATVVKLE